MKRRSPKASEKDYLPEGAYGFSKYYALKRRMLMSAIFNIRRDGLASLIVLIPSLFIILPPPLPLIDFAFVILLCLSIAALLKVRFRTTPKTATFTTSLYILTLPLRIMLFTFSTRTLLATYLSNDHWSAAPEVFMGKILTSFGRAVTEGGIAQGAGVLLILMFMYFYTLRSVGKQAESVPDSHSDERDPENSGINYYASTSLFGCLEGLAVVAGLGAVLFCALQREGWGISGTSHDFSVFVALLIGTGVLCLLPVFLIVLATDMALTKETARWNAVHHTQYKPHTRGFYLAGILMAAPGVLEMMKILDTPGVPYFLCAELLIIAGKLLEKTSEKGAAADGAEAYQNSGSREEMKQRAIKEAEETARRQLTGLKGSPPSMSGTTGSVTPEPIKKPSETLKLIEIDPVCVEVGRGLLELVDPNRGAVLLHRISALRRHMALEYGIIVPGIRFRDDLQLPDEEYRFRVRGVEVAAGRVQMNHLLAVGPEEQLEKVKKIPERTLICTPVFNLRGIWILPEERKETEQLGCTLFEPVGVISAHITEVVRNHLADLVGLQETRCFLSHLKESNPVVVEELNACGIPLKTITAVLKNLLRERVSIRDLELIATTLVNYSHMTIDAGILTEVVREALGGVITAAYLNMANQLRVLQLGQEYEEILSRAIEYDGPEPIFHLDIDSGVELLAAIEAEGDACMEEGFPPVLVCSPRIRRAMRKLAFRNFPSLAVLSWQEIPPDVEVVTCGLISPRKQGQALLEAG